MIGDRDVQNPCPSLTSKRQRHDEPGDTLNIAPPAKISKTSSGPMRHRREESTNPDAATDELEKNVIESVKHNNSALAFHPKGCIVVNPFENPAIAICSPQCKPF